MLNEKSCHSSACTNCCPNVKSQCFTHNYNMNCCPLMKCPCLTCELCQLVPAPDTFMDPRDGRVYKTVKIGKQVWMAENLAFDYVGSIRASELRNRIVTDCVPPDKKSLCQGRLYTWESAMKAIPPGWHLPNRDEWNDLIRFVGNNGTSLRSKQFSGTDDYGFAAMPSFIIPGIQNVLAHRGVSEWWSATECNGSECDGFRKCNGYKCAYSIILYESRNHTEERQCSSCSSSTIVKSVRCILN